MTFQQKLDALVAKNNSLLCVGLDPDLEKIPKHVLHTTSPLFEFNKAIIDATSDIVCCYKPNSAFYEAHGEKGIGELQKTCDYIKRHYPEIPILLDFKRGDIGNTNKGYATFAFEYLQVDAVTLHPYQGIEALQPFLDYKEKGLFILCKTSNPGSGEFQNLHVNTTTPEQLVGKAAIHAKQEMQDTLYEKVATVVSRQWNKNDNCFLVVGATYPDELKRVRDIVGDMTILVPGLGAQGGDIEAVMKAGLTAKKAGLLINSSREIVYAGNDKDFTKKAREKAETLRDKINTYRNL